MRVMVAESDAHETLPRHFELTELGGALCSDAPSNTRDFIRMMNREPYIAFSQLYRSVATGRSAFDEGFGKARVDWLREHPEEAALFQRAMIAISDGDNEAVAEAYDFRPCSRVIDVGGGHGQLLSLILERHQNITGILFDLPSGVDAAKTRTGSAGGRMHFMCGDFFDAVPSGA